jgi:branched-chain amino acid aminotransferase
MKPAGGEELSMQNDADSPVVSLDHLRSTKPQFPSGIAFIDGEYVPISEARISILDWGFLRSDATYDVVHVWKNRFFQLDKHLDRFLASVAKLRMTLPVDRATLTEILRQCVRRAGLADAYVEMICTRGHSPTFSRDPRDATNRLICFAIPFGWIANEAQRRRGLSITISSVVRIPPSSVDPTVKNYHWLDLVRALYEAYDRGTENVVLVNDRGEITEGPGFNIFAVSGGAVVTPPSGVLLGITRQSVLDICSELGIAAQASTLTADGLTSADEVFITSTAGGVMPVTRIDDRPVGDGTAGPITSRIHEAYWLHHDDPDWSTSA